MAGTPRRAFVILLALLLTGPVVLAQDPVKLFPNNYRLLFENDAVVVIKVHYGPHEKLAVHDHPKTPTVYVYLNDSGRVRYQHVGDEAFTVIRPPVTKGSYRVSKGRLEHHSVENLAETSSEFLRVELKQSPLGSIPHFRGTAPMRFLQSSNRMEIQDADKGFAVRRVICVGASPCELEASSLASLVVAFSPLTITDTRPGARSKKLEDGAVQWLDGAQSGTVNSASEAPAHLIRIFIPNPR